LAHHQFAFFADVLLKVEIRSKVSYSVKILNEAFSPIHHLALCKFSPSFLLLYL